MRLPVLSRTSKARGIFQSIGCLIPLVMMALLMLISRLIHFVRTR